MKEEIVAFIQTERGGVQLNKKVASTIAEYLVEVVMVEDVNEVKGSNLKSLKTHAGRGMADHAQREPPGRDC